MKIWRSSVHELRCQYRKSFSLCTHSSQLCKSAPRSRQITTPVPHHSVFYRPDALPAAQPTASKHRRHSAFLYYVYWCAFTLQPNSDFGGNNRLRTLKPQFHCAFSHDFCAGFFTTIFLQPYRRCTVCGECASILQKQLNQSWATLSCGPNEPCIKWR